MSTQPHDQHDPYQEVLVSPRYLAGSDGSGEVGFAPVAHWPHHYLDEGPCQLLVTSPDQRIRIGWFGDDFDLWKISAAEEAVAAPRWTASFNHVTPAELARPHPCFKAPGIKVGALCWSTGDSQMEIGAAHSGEQQIRGNGVRAGAAREPAEDCARLGHDRSRTEAARRELVALCHR